MGVFGRTDDGEIMIPTELKDREIDYLVAGKIFDVPVAWMHDQPNGKLITLDTAGRTANIAAIAYYSFQMRWAWEVENAMRERGYWMKLCAPWDAADKKYSVGFMPWLTVHCGSSWVQASEDCAARAICIAALKTLDAEAVKL